MRTLFCNYFDRFDQLFPIPDLTMKRILIVLLINSLLSHFAVAQEYKPFKVNLALGFAKPIGNNASGGLSFAVEPKYALTNRLEAGLKLSMAIMARKVAFDNINSTSELKAVGSALVTGNYFLKDAGFRPFIGAGIGVFSLAQTELTISRGGQEQSKTIIAGGNKFGGLIRAGFKTGHFQLSLDYNHIPNTIGVAVFNSGQVYGFVSKSSYFDINLGLAIGGGRR